MTNTSVKPPQESVKTLMPCFRGFDVIFVNNFLLIFRFWDFFFLVKS